MGTLRLGGVTKSFEAKHGSRRVLDGIDLLVPSGELVVILGPSGCGKTTLLKVIAGLVRPDSGDYQLTLDGLPIRGPSPERSIVFQAYTSFPWLTARENVRFGLQFLGIPEAEQYARADAFLSQVGLSAFRDDYPRDLSGGQQQRIAIARTLAAEPKIILMDEPFAALDAQTRESMQDDLLNLQRRTKSTILFVTHDIAEAAHLGDRVLVLSRIPARITGSFDLRAERAKVRVAAGASDEDDRELFRNNPRFMELQREFRIALSP